MPTSRQRKVSELVQRVASNALAEQCRAYGYEIVTITGSDVSPDMRQAILFFSASQSVSVDEWTQRLNTPHFKHSVRQAINSKAQLRASPRVKFVADPGIIAGGVVDSVLNEITISADECSQDGEDN